MDWDIVVVGASSAGMHAATQLAQAGKSVAVLEQAQVLHPARRTLIVTPHLHRILPDLQAPVLLHKIRDLVLASPDAEARITLNNPDLIIERGAVLQAFAARAQAAGVTLVLDRRFLGIRAEGDGATLEFQNAAREKIRVRTCAVIGADGVFSDIARAVGLPHPPSVPILQAEIDLPRDWDPALTKVWFDTNETRFFYWLIPESDSRVVVGLVGDERAQMRHILRRFVDREGFKPLAYQGARIAMYQPGLRAAIRVGSAPVRLVGDAAGHVKVTTVGGTVSGLLGAEAARSLIHGRSYSVELGAVTREMALHWGMRAALDRFDNRAYNELVSSVNPRVGAFLSAHNRDEMAGVAWQLPFLQPRLVTLAPQILLRTLRKRSPKPRIPASAQD